MTNVKLGGVNDGPVLQVSLTLRGGCASAVINAALARKSRPIDVLADAIEILCTDNLFDALLDDKTEAA